MRLKYDLIIDGKAKKVGVEMNRVFPELAGKRVSWFSKSGAMLIDHILPQ